MAADMFLAPLPGPLIGLVLLTVHLVLERRTPRPITEMADCLHAHFGALFIPAGVGVIDYLDVIRADFLPIAAALVFGTLLTFAGTLLSATMLRARAGGSVDQAM